jgi:hypothetical protein
MANKADHQGKEKSSIQNFHAISASPQMPQLNYFKQGSVVREIEGLALPVA